jgi:hypothetical protein
VSSTKEGARARRNRSRAAITTATALVAAAAFAGTANADLTLAPTDATGFPASVTDAPGQSAAPCFSPSDFCAADAPTFNDANKPGAEAFYWSGTASVPLKDGVVDASFDVEQATADDGTQTTFQRIQFGSKDTPDLAAGDYTFSTPYGVFTATLNPDKAQNWRRIESTSAAIGQIDHFLVSAAAPAGYFGDGNADPSPVVGGADVGTVVVTAPDGEVGTTADWTITGRMQSTPIPTPPPVADADKDGVPNSRDLCPNDAGPATNRGCPVATTTSGGGATGSSAGTTNTTATIVRVIPGPAQAVLGAQASSPLAVSRLTLARRISVTRLRGQGLRGTMNVQEGTSVVRFAIYKARGGQKTGRALYTTTRTPTHAGLFRFSLRSAKLAKLKPGQYVTEVRAGRSAASLGAVKKFVFTVTR